MYARACSCGEAAWRTRPATRPLFPPRKGDPQSRSRLPSGISLPTAHCLLPTAHCLLPTAHCLLPTAPRQDFFPLQNSKAFSQKRTCAPHLRIAKRLTPTRRQLIPQIPPPKNSFPWKQRKLLDQKPGFSLTFATAKPRGMTKGASLMIACLVCQNQ
jgi:hypothetical protein